MSPKVADVFILFKQSNEVEKVWVDSSIVMRFLVTL